MNDRRKSSRGSLIASAVAGLLAAGLVGPPTSAAQGADPIHCYGINACKGKGDCGGKGHSCAGENTCKGKGYLKLDKETCLKIQGARLTEESAQPAAKKRKES